MQYSIVNYKTVRENSDFRIDAEYYYPEFLMIEERLSLKKHDILKNITSSNSRYSQPTYTENSDVKVINSQYLREDEIKYDEARSGIGKIVPYESIMICSTGVGTLGRVNINYLKNIKISVDSHVNIIQSKKINPYFLLSFLQSKYGKSQIERNISGSSGQIEIYPRDFEKFKIIIPSINFQLQIEKVVKQAYQLLDHSKSLYSQAEELLLSELGLLNWKPKHMLTFVKNFSDTQKAERIDAEYFQPKYEEIIEAVKKYKGGFDELGNSVRIKKSIEPGSEAYQEEGVPFVRVSNLSKFELSNNNQQFISENLYEELKTHQPKKGEILLSKDATPGIAYYLNEEPQKMIVSGGILRLKIDNQQILPEYLTLVLNSVIVQKQIERDAGGSIINHWRPDQVKATLIPILIENKQKEIKELIEKSFNNRTLSKSLLEIAKRGVEIAIEKDEEAAEDWINLEISKLNIKI